MTQKTPAEILKASIADWETRMSDDGIMPRFNPYPDAVKKVLQQHGELLRAAQNLTAYKHCLKDGAGREETDAGIQSAIKELEKAIRATVSA